ncbi:TetR/AcrR family transcriptional regulator [Amycolatopsis sp.]|uniref:TetR/AcrR family transcriptional regulator n=1 Tax=Amycolatopsis sp. TaxID=37632 RepID=UPI002C354E4A|nr:TetR/AcrR family transcriptional regulator [Amycolatopsis sp.]HVV08242.1 TetR/AcrR family transcriptional regulator [Amycolatopsis sp.]
MAKRKEARVRATGPVSADLIEQEAVRLFSERTYPVVGMRDISDAVGILPGSLYVHITSKEELLLNIVVRGIQNYLDAIRPMAESTEPAPVRLRGAIKAHIRVLSGGVDRTRVAFHQWTYLNPANRKRIVAMRGRYEDLFATIIADGIASGEFRKMRSQRIAVLSTIGTLNSATEWYSPTGTLSPEEVGDQLADGALLGLQQQ